MYNGKNSASRSSGLCAIQKLPDLRSVLREQKTRRQRQRLHRLQSRLRRDQSPRLASPRPHWC